MSALSEEIYRIFDEHLPNETDVLQHLKKLHHHHPDVNMLHVKDEYGESAGVFLAVVNKCAHALEYFLSFGTLDRVEASSVFLNALQSRHDQIVQILLRQEDWTFDIHYRHVEKIVCFDMDTIDAFLKRTPRNIRHLILFAAIQKHRFDVFRAYYPNFSQNVRSSYGSSLLHKAVESNEFDTCTFLLEHNPHMHWLTNRYMQTPLHLAVRNIKVSTKIAILLLEKGADVHAVDTFHETPLRYAICARRGARIICTLLQKGADATYVSSEFHDTSPLRFLVDRRDKSVSEEEQSVKCMKMIIAHHTPYQLACGLESRPIPMTAAGRVLHRHFVECVFAKLVYPPSPLAKLPLELREMICEKV